MIEPENMSGGPGGELASGQSEGVVRGPIAPDDLFPMRRTEPREQEQGEMGRLSAGMVHDFNNLLMLIIGTADLRLSMPGLADPIRRDLEVIRSAGERAARITKQFPRFPQEAGAEAGPLGAGEDIDGTDEPVSRQASGTETVMVVEEEPGVRRLCAEALEREGYRVVCAKDGRDAIAMARHAGRVHVLITDSRIPGMNGRSLFERLCFEQPGLRVLYTCGYNDRPAGKGMLKEDEGNLLRKPISPRKLAWKVRALLDVG